MSTYPAKLTSQTKNVGHTGAEAMGGGVATDNKAVWGPFAVPTPSALTITAIKVYCYVTSGSASTRAIIYMDNGSNKPTTLLGQSDEVAVTNTTAAWVTFPFSAPIVVPAAMSIHIGFHNGGSASVWFHELFSSGVLDRNTAADIYSGGASDPFGTPTTYTGKDGSVYAVGTATLELNLALGREDQPRVRLGSREKEAAKAGQRGTIVIQSLHHGSGQHIARDPMMYEFADGMFADEPGVLRTRGEAETLVTVATAQPWQAWMRGGIFTAEYQSGENRVAIVTPSNVYHLDANDPPNVATVLAPFTNSNFTGSFAEFGRYTFLGQHNKLSNASWAGRYDKEGDLWSNNAGFNAEFLTTQGEKLWRGWHTYPSVQGRDLNFSWADAAANTPVFSSDYMLEESLDHYMTDIAIIGPHLVAAVTSVFDHKTRLVSLDTAGLFTDLLRDISEAVQFSPLLGGQVLWLSGRARGLWMSDVTSFRMLNTDAISPSLGELVIPYPVSLTGQDSTIRLVNGGVHGGIGSATDDATLFSSVYGTMTKRDGNAVSGSFILQTDLTGEGLQTHTVLTPEGFSALENSHVMAMRMGRTLMETGMQDPVKKRFLQFVTATPEANALNSTVKFNRLELWDGPAAPIRYDAGIKFLRTSRYVGDDWVTKQGELLRGYITKLPTNSSAVVRVYLDGDVSETYNFSVNTIGPFAQSLPSNVIGRDVALDMETNANGSVIIEFPWSLDYFAVPDQKDIVRLGILAGRDQVTPGGTLTDKTRAETLAILEGLCTSKERWTLTWWDGTPDWDVIPLGHEAVEIEPEHVPGAGAAVAWLALQRL